MKRVNRFLLVTSWWQRWTKKRVTAKKAATRRKFTPFENPVNLNLKELWLKNRILELFA
jgi:hypothetical protein